ncbi:MAG: hypothetical protein ACK4UO_17650 [Pseudolabrys sp.]
MYKRIFAAVAAVGLFAAGPTPLSSQATAQTTQAAPAPAPSAKPKKPPTPGQIAAQARMKKCAGEWKEAKAAGKIENGQKWPQYWSACNKRLKAAGAT